MKTNAIIFSKEKTIVKYNGEKDTTEWEVDFEYKISGISRIDTYVFVTTYSNWGFNYTSLIDFNSGKKLWTINQIFYSIHIIGKTLIYIDLKKVFHGIDIDTSKEKFSIKNPTRWSASRIVVINAKCYLFSKKKTFLLNTENGKISETQLPRKLDPKELGVVLDEFQININTAASGGDGGYMFMGDVGGGGDFGGGDAGGGDAG